MNYRHEFILMNRINISYDILYCPKKIDMYINLHMFK